MRILSVNVGASRPITIKHKTVQTGIYKTPATGPVHVTRFGLQGDVRIEFREMGLEHSAVYAYPHEHYAYWQSELSKNQACESCPMGHFGENLTVTGLLEEEVRIGDVFRFGTAVLQVAHPRIPCAKLNQHMGLHFSSIFMASRKVGFYLRVLSEGNVAHGDSIELLERDDNSPTMEEFVRVTQFEFWDAVALQHLLGARDLVPAWREMIEAKLARTKNAKGGWHGLREFEVVKREEECENTASLYLTCVRGRPLSPFHGGQQLVVALGGRSAHQQRRAYAISSSPFDLSTYRITVQRMVAPEPTMPDGYVSSYLTSIKVGERILCTAPFGAQRPEPNEACNGSRHIILSQGLGIAPMLSLLYELEGQRAKEVYLFYEPAVPEPEILLQETRALMARNAGFHTILCKPLDLDVAKILTHVSLEQTCVQIAGTNDFAERLKNELVEFGLPASSIMVQRFG